jgi:Zn-dependent protease with chaperone function/Zn-finger nucleic acid-binding protein
VSAAAGTRRTLFDIEREKRWRIWLLFALLLAMVFVSAWVVCLIVTVSLYVSFPVVDTVSWVFTLRGIAVILSISVAGSLLYWFSAQVGARGRLLRAMHCDPLDQGDRYHQRLANIVEEMRIATGAPKVECVTVRTLGLNAFAFSDLRGGGVVGVTEGALARLSRQQLEAVVAHEFGHVLSGTYVTETVSCLLFGIYSELGERLEEATLAAGGTRAAPLAIVAILLRGWLWLLQLASSVTSAALSREREREADLAAARYTRDPLSLAEALRIISRHPGGTGYIPEGLAPLCIRDTSRGGPRMLGRWSDTHPPIGERIDVLLALAAVSPDEFARQADTAADNFAEREHWTAPPAAGSAGRHIGVDVSGAAPAASGAVPTGAAPAAATAAGSMACPSCGGSLATADYEGLRVVVCPSCGGRLLKTADIGKILARREVAFTDQQVRLADLIDASGDELRRAANVARGRASAGLIPCPHCSRTMIRRHYSYEHAVEVDYCSICDLYWFEKDELEALQVLAERQAG